MVLLTLLAMLVGLVAARETGRVRVYALLMGMACLALYLLWLQEHLAGRIDFFITDEALYFNRGVDPRFRWSAVTQHGYLWIAVNRWMETIDFRLAGHGMKLLNIPLLVLFVLLLYRIFGRDPRVLALPLVLPYLLWLAIFNMRDVAIMLAATAVVYGLFVTPRIQTLVVALGGITMVMLRPEFFVVLAIACAVAALRSARRTGNWQWKRVVVVGLLIALVAGPPLASRVRQAAAWVEYTKLINYDAFAAVRLGEYRTSSPVSDFGVSLVRYTVTPLPHSLLGRIAGGGSEVWGLTDDLVRFAHQFGYFCCLALVGLRIRRLRRLFQMLTPGQLALLLFLLAYAPIYSFHLFGAMHQRLKVPFQLAVALLAIGLSHTGDRKSGAETSDDVAAAAAARTSAG